MPTQAAAEATGIGPEALALLDALEGSKPAIHLAATDRRAEAIASFLQAVEPDAGACWLPAWDCMPYDWSSPSAGVMGRRMRVLAAMGERQARLVLTSPEALIQRLPPREAVRPWRLTAGEALDADAFLRWTTTHGYRSDDRVDEPGEFVRLGLVIDVFPAGADQPLRVRLRDGLVEDISLYDPVTQRTANPVQGTSIDAATELPPRPGEEGDGPAEAAPLQRGGEHWLPEAYPSLEILLDHLPGAQLLATERSLRRAGDCLEALPAARDEYARAAAQDDPIRRPPDPDRLYLSRKEWRAVHDSAVRLDIAEATAAPTIHGVRSPRRRLAEAIEAAERTVLVGATLRDRDRIARAAGRCADVERVSTWKEARAVPKGKVAVLGAPLAHGFQDEGLLVLTAREVLGHQVGGEGAATVVPPWLAEMQDLRRGDLVVHEEAGLGRYEGLEAVGDEEAIRVTFAGDESLLVPPADAGRLWRYGHDEGEAPLDHLGGKGWSKHRAKLERDLERIAQRLVAAARAREGMKVAPLEAKGAAYGRVVEGFGWEETPDQAAAIRAVRRDLASGRPMDRLLVGDVGFGKTEVAIRAVATAALAGRQVALVAPTTVLARQHGLTFERRLEGTGLRVATLSRLTPPAEARRVREGLASGEVDVVVGTHAVLGRATRFNRLGLVVIDEEQRFGRAHKTALRKLAEDVHMLSMSATPIPGTLEGALAGLRELSLLATAPARRRPIRTNVATFSPDLLCDTLRREWRRGGQSFVIVPRVEMIEGVAERIRKLLPRLRLRVAHGDLPARRIDEEMTAFADRDGDVLLATAIVESGLDVPRANTMLVLRPDLFGLAQLHQLRGRVGRGDRQSYCWLLTDPDHPPTEAAQERLDALAGATLLGAGFAIAALDLDRRGPGDLFGAGQSGHEARVGPALHADMLATALLAARGELVPPRPEVRLEAEAALPESYIPHPDMRATLYNRIGHVRTVMEAERLRQEVEDRFGPPPPEVAALLALAELRARAGAMGAAVVTAGPTGVALDFPEGQEPPDPPRDAERAGQRIVWHEELPDPSDRLEAIGRCLEALER